MSFCSYPFFYEKWSFILINCLKITRELIKNYSNYHFLVNWLRIKVLTSCLIKCRWVVSRSVHELFCQRIVLFPTPLHHHHHHNPHLLSLKRSNVLLWHLIWTANLEPKTDIDVSKNVVFNVWIRPLILDDLRRLHDLSPEEAPRTSRWGVGELIAEIRMRTCNCLI